MTAQRRRLAAIASTALLAIVLTAPAGAQSAKPQTTGAPHCSKKGSKTIAANRHVRVFRATDDYVYGCRRSASRAFALGVATECQNNDKIDTAVVAGTLVALNISTCSLYDSSSSVRLVDLRNGSVLFNAAPMSSFENGSGAIRGMVLTPRGSFAWLAVRGGGAGGPAEAEVRRRARFSSTRSVTLDSGADIDPRSLRRRGARATWRKGATQRSARLS